MAAPSTSSPSAASETHMSPEGKKFRLTRKEFKKNIAHQLEALAAKQKKRHITVYQIYMALHDLVFEFDSAISVGQMVDFVKKTDESVSQLPVEELRREIFQTLTEGVVSNWCRCTTSGFFKPTSDPPLATEADKAKMRSLKGAKSQMKSEADKFKEEHNVPRNLVLHGEVSNEDEVPGFIVTVDEFVEFMKRAQEVAGAKPPSPLKL